jgi:hypothetical protein
MTIIPLEPGDVAQCRRCGRITTPGGRTSKNKREWPPVLRQRARALRSAAPPG